ncbi:hypothetical protein [Pseudoalteromonas ruthenica]|uniref:hypothetical protein n=1 Tax=Pseudoalteromonas ruthenica TaxID=151081 RepID=UPI00110AE28E|nr:hypothetical protein [Pseudoalteromonas ruthenica]TMP23801.1 hypothetical protein CWC06_09620 [Pseudoalteromonas ruthenica]
MNTLLLAVSAMAFNAPVAPQSDAALKGSGGIVIVDKKKKENRTINGSGGIVIVDKKKKEN